MCKNCSGEFLPKDRRSIFCSRSCAGIFNGKSKKPRSAESKMKTSETLRKKIQDGTIPLPVPPKRPRLYEWPLTRIYKRIVCNFCEKEFWQTKSNQRCCSKECRDNICSENHVRKKRILFYNPFDGKTVTLQSQWELTIAQWLTESNLDWERPSKRIKWHDTTLGKNRTYLPDFYLRLLNCYVDVKNPIKQLQDADKIRQLSSIIPLIVGDIDHVKQQVALSAGVEPACVH